jgi:hypothetical protein
MPGFGNRHPELVSGSRERGQLLPLWLMNQVQHDEFIVLEPLPQPNHSTKSLCKSPGNIGSLSNRSIAFQRQTGASPCASIQSRTISMPRP